MARKKAPDATQETPAKPAAKKTARKSQTVAAGEVAKVVAPKKREAKPAKAKPISKRAPVNRKPDLQKVEVPAITEEAVAEALDTLSPDDLAFCEAYLASFNGTRAWLAVYSAKSENAAAVAASKKLRTDKVRAYIAKRMKQAFDDAGLASDKLIQTYQHVAYGDVNELVEYRREACRYCHGIDHLYQYTPQEQRDREAAWRKHLEEEDLTEDECPFDPRGGVGFNPKLDPHPECPECHGDGRGNVIFKDTRHLSPAGLAMYAGAKIGKDGIEVKTASQDRAREMLARILKLFEDKTEVNIVNMDATTLEEKFAAKMREAHERQAKVLAERGVTPEA